MSEVDIADADIDQGDEKPESKPDARKLAIRRKIEEAQEAKRLREEFGEDY